MCGRYTLRTPASVLAERFGFDTDRLLEPRFNIAPSQPALCLRTENGRRRLVELRWGLVPGWATDPKIGHRAINARAESVAEKPMFRDSFQRRRCLVLADGYYEWHGPAGKKQPYYFRMMDDQPFAFAGLWARWRGQGGAGEPAHAAARPEPGRPAGPLETFTIITTDANELTRAVHDRMPVILPATAHELWLDPDFAAAEVLRDLLVPCPSELLTMHPVSTLVNRPENDRADCILPA